MQAFPVLGFNFGTNLSFSAPLSLTSSAHPQPLFAADVHSFDPQRLQAVNAYSIDWRFNNNNSSFMPNNTENNTGRFQPTFTFPSDLQIPPVTTSEFPFVNSVPPASVTSTPQVDSVSDEIKADDENYKNKHTIHEFMESRDKVLSVSSQPDFSDEDDDAIDFLATKAKSDLATESLPSTAQQVEASKKPVEQLLELIQEEEKIENAVQLPKNDQLTSDSTTISASSPRPSDESIKYSAEELSRKESKKISNLPNLTIDIKTEDADEHDPVTAHMEELRGYIDNGDLERFKQRLNGLPDFSIDEKCENNDCLDQSLLNYAAQIGQTVFVQHLIERGANILSTDSEGLTSLHHAVLTFNLELVRLLIQAAIKKNILPNLINSITEHGDTVIHLALENPQESNIFQVFKIIELLMLNGHDTRLLNKKNNEEITPLDLYHTLENKMKCCKEVSEIHWIFYKALQPPTSPGISTAPRKTVTPTTQVKKQKTPRFGPLGSLPGHLLGMTPSVTKVKDQKLTKQPSGNKPTRKAPEKVSVKISEEKIEATGIIVNDLREIFNLRCNGSDETAYQLACDSFRKISQNNHKQCLAFFIKLMAWEAHTHPPVDCNLELSNDLKNRYKWLT